MTPWGPNVTVGLSRIVSQTLDATGHGVAYITNVNSAALWIVRQISVITAPTKSGTTCEVTYGIGIVDTSYFAGTGDTAGGDPPIYLKASEVITLTWTNGPLNGTGICQFFYDEVIQ